MSEKVLVTPAELSNMLKGEQIVLIDTRDPTTYAAGHLPNAVNIHDIFTYLATSTSEGVAAMRDKFASIFGAAGLSGNETAVVYEQSMNTGFGQSCRGYVLLRYLGYPKIKILHGGFVAWTATSLPTSTEVPTPERKTFPLDPSAAGILVDLQGMKAAVADPNIVKLDTRDVDEWIAESSSPYGKDFCPRKGRIPGAVWIEWHRMMKPSPNGPMFKSREEILAECATVGVTPETPVVLYCFKGARASNTLVALNEAGVKNVNLYFGSWNEWSRDPSLPIETGPPYKVSSAAGRCRLSSRHMRPSAGHGHSTAVRQALMKRKIVVTLEGREDGGLRADSDDVPGFVLSHSDPDAVLRNVKPALEGILSNLLKEPVAVEELPGRDHELIPSKRVYLTSRRLNGLRIR
jgi:thiosulfate/3-mercaptopyruvate sulfurtransferase